MKTFDRKDVYSWSNCEEAEKYIGKKGYMSNSLQGLSSSIELGYTYPLWNIRKDQTNCFNFGYNDLGLFLPIDKVKEVEEEKKWRPFKTIQEFRNTLCDIEFSEPIQIRCKDNHNNSIMTIFTGYQELGNELATICLGAWILTPYKAFNDFELYNDQTEEWQPFGVQE